MLFDFFHAQRGSLSLRNKLWLIIVIPMTVLLAIGLSLNAKGEISHGRRLMIESTSSIVQAISQDFERINLLNDQAVAADIVDRLRPFEQVVYLYFFNMDGEVLFAYRRDDAPPTPPPAFQEEGRRFDTEGLKFFSPVYSGGRTLGVVFCQVSTLQLDRSIRKTIIAMILAGLAMLIVGIFAAAILKETILRPILALSRTASKIALHNNYSLRASKYADDEVGALSDAFNVMLDRVQHANAEIESKVAQRTSQLEASRKRFRRLLEATPDGMIISDEAGKITFVNAQAETLFGYSRNELLGQAIELLVPQTFRERHVHDRMTSFESPNQKTMALGRKLTACRKDGSVVSVEISLAALESDAGSVTLASIRDITERKLLESRLAQAQKLEAIGQLAAGIAHEINTPIQFIGDNTRFLQECYDDLMKVIEVYAELVSTSDNDASEEASTRVSQVSQATDLVYLTKEIPQAIQQLLEGVDRVSEIVRAMKEFSHPGSKAKKEINVNHAIKNTVAMSQNEWKSVAELTTDLSPDLPLVPCLPNEFNQVLLNIIVNASHAIGDIVDEEGEAKGLIHIVTRRDGDWAEIRISDNGSGIPEAIRSKIFDPFFTTKEVGRGTGQGLAIAHSVIVVEHEGTIRIDSDLGEGTTFVIRLPLADTSLF